MRPEEVMSNTLDVRNVEEAMAVTRLEDEVMPDPPSEEDISFSDPEAALSDSEFQETMEQARAPDTIAERQLALLARLHLREDLSDLTTAPLFKYSVLEHAQKVTTQTSGPVVFPQYGLLAGDVESFEMDPPEDPRLYYNVAAPSSVFICGSQGSGKSHTLSCLLENCLIQSDVLGCLPRPLTGIVFHYDDHASDSRVAPCEAAYLGSNPAVKVRVLCAPTNIGVIQASYGALENVTVEALRLDEADLNTKRMLGLMAFEKNQPLYVQVIQRILRDMRVEQHLAGGTFDYIKFAERLRAERLMPDQERALKQRLDTLESFMVKQQIVRRSGNKPPTKRYGTDWTPKAGELIIVDLTCPCITAPMACALFNISLSIFLGQDSSAIGRVIALDEAHRYMGDSSECETFTNSILTAIRVQRHVGARIIISTQEPTISPKLLDLCNTTIVHRFSSPDWLNVLSKHLAGISKLSYVTQMAASDEPSSSSSSPASTTPPENPILGLFAQIVDLRPGEALIFAPSAIVAMETEAKRDKDKIVPRKLAHNVLRVVVRERITADGGRSVMAS
ncbi:hypothetical protein GGS20DRAFT_41318 [Poronia punctata]|nr:hypothetical protein GGS20DRAFT_41318 [Poronia punctata]